MILWLKDNYEDLVIWWDELRDSTRILAAGVTAFVVFLLLSWVTVCLW